MNDPAPWEQLQRTLEEAQITMINATKRIRDQAGLIVTLMADLSDLRHQYATLLAQYDLLQNEANMLRAKNVEIRRDLNRALHDAYGD